MTPDCILIQSPSVDFHTFLGATHKALGRNLAEASDAKRNVVSDVERFLSCLAAMRAADAPVGLPPHLLPHACFSLLIAADTLDMQDILQCCAGMPFVATETILRGTQIAVVTGTLTQWRDAVIAGCGKGVVPTVRHGFNRIYALFCSAGLNVWGADYQPREAADQTFLLERCY